MQFPIAGIFFIGLAVAIIVGLLRIFIIRRRFQVLDSTWPELRGTWTAAEIRGKTLVVLGEEPVLNESLLDLSEEKESLPLALALLPSSSPCDPPPPPAPPSSSLPNAFSPSPSPSSSLLLSVLILQPLPPDFPLDDSSDLPEIAIGSRLVNVDSRDEEAWKSLLESRSRRSDAIQQQPEEVQSMPPLPSAI